MLKNSSRQALLPFVKDTSGTGTSGSKHQGDSFPPQATHGVVSRFSAPDFDLHFKQRGRVSHVAHVFSGPFPALKNG